MAQLRPSPSGGATKVKIEKYGRQVSLPAAPDHCRPGSPIATIPFQGATARTLFSGQQSAEAGHRHPPAAVARKTACRSLLSPWTGRPEAQAWARSFEAGPRASGASPEAVEPTGQLPLKSWDRPANRNRLPGQLRRDTGVRQTPA